MQFLASHRILRTHGFLQKLCSLQHGSSVSASIAFFSSTHFDSISSPHHDFSSSSLQSPVQKTCSLVLEAYLRQPHLRFSPSKLNLDMDADSLTHEQAISAVASLASEEGSMVALSFFYWAIGFPKFRYFMRLYIVCTMSLIGKCNLERAHEVVECMVGVFAEIGKLKEAVDMILDMRNQGLVLTTRVMNRIILVAAGMGLVEYAGNVFDEMSARGVYPDSCTYKSIIVGYCRNGDVLEADRWICEMMERGFVVDNATFTLIIKAFCEKSLVNRAVWFFHKVTKMGLSPNLINYSSMISGLCKRGSVKQAFELLEEMVKNGWKPNVYTHTSLIHGLCKKGWTERAFRLFLKLVRSDNYKPNVHTYTAMISGYCKEDKLSRAEMLFERMKEQGLVPNTNTYTTLIDGHCKAGNFSKAYELMELMSNEGFFPNICTYNAIVDGLCKRGRAEEAFELLSKGFQNQIEADGVTYTILISEQQRMMKDSEKLFDEVVKLGLAPTKETYTSMICGYCREKNISLAVKFFQKMSDQGCVPDSISYGALISGLCKESRLDEARQLYDTMIDKGLSPCEVTRVSLAYEYCKTEDCASAMVILERLNKKLWIRSVHTLIRKLCCEKKVALAALFFHKLLDKEVNVDRVTLAAFITACTESNKYALVSDLSERISKGIG
ncbi:hypothetical protein IC582_028882 [Cucumis melo]